MSSRRPTGSMPPRKRAKLAAHVPTASQAQVQPDFVAVHPAAGHHDGAAAFKAAATASVVFCAVLGLCMAVASGAMTAGAIDPLMSILSDMSSVPAWLDTHPAEVATVLLTTCADIGFLWQLPRTFRSNFLSNKLDPNSSPQGFYDSFRCSRETFHKMYAATIQSKAWRSISRRRRRSCSTRVPAKHLFAAVLYQLMHASTYREIEVRVARCDSRIDMSAAITACCIICALTRITTVHYRSTELTRS